MATPPTLPTAPQTPGEDDHWRSQVLQTLEDCTPPAQKRFAALRLMAYFIVAILFAILSILMAEILSDRQMRYKPAERATLEIGWFIIAVFVFARLRNWLLRGFWRARAHTAEQELKRAGSRRPVLYLRSFQLDSRLGRPSFLERFLGSIPLANEEQNVTRALRKVGPMIAIGRPGESLPELGAARFYVDHSLWQQKVIEIVDMSQYVVWATGVTEGLRWEISHLIASLDSEKLIVWAHPQVMGVGAPEREADWRRFLETMGPLFPKPLPEVLGRAHFFYFTKDWEWRAVAPPFSLRGILNPHAAALRRLLSVKQGRAAESKVLYRGAKRENIENGDFGTLIGNAGRPVDWRRLAAFWLARFAFFLPLLAIPDPSGELQLSSGRVLNMALHGALIPCLVALLAFRWIRSVTGASAVAAVASLAIEYGLAAANAPSSGLRASFFLPYLAAQSTMLFAFLFFVAACVRRIPSLPLALWLGSTLATIAALWIPVIFDVQSFEPTPTLALFFKFLGPVAFAFAFWMSLRWFTQGAKPAA